MFSPYAPLLAGACKAYGDRRRKIRDESRDKHKKCILRPLEKKIVKNMTIVLFLK
jgi:hypothetical protein